MENEHRFTLGQRCEGEGMCFDVVSLDPLQVKCISAQVTACCRSGVQSRFTPGNVYSLKMLLSSRRTFGFLRVDFGEPAPWVIVSEDGHVESH